MGIWRPLPRSCSGLSSYERVEEFAQDVNGHDLVDRGWSLALKQLRMDSPSPPSNLANISPSSSHRVPEPPSLNPPIGRADEVIHLSSSSVHGCLSYSDKVPDGFHLIRGLDSFVWSVSTDLQENGRIPTVCKLNSMDPSINSSLEIVA
ncbi:unnamed protein product [Lupinus luteus]|uniref:EDR1/CTR1/ARMC3-like peptidase-like domain-containing protein n=1 Tax=Lupinus luteus TaxID=3873 RepID=A0AAV1XJW9_LUPLU